MALRDYTDEEISPLASGEPQGVGMGVLSKIRGAAGTFPAETGFMPAGTATETMGRLNYREGTPSPNVMPQPSNIPISPMMPTGQTTPLNQSRGGFTNFWNKLPQDKQQAISSGLLYGGLDMVARGGEYSRTPVSTSGELGKSLMTGLGAYEQSIATQQEQGLARQKMGLEERRVGAEEMRVLAEMGKKNIQFNEKSGKIIRTDPHGNYEILDSGIPPGERDNYTFHQDTNTSVIYKENKATGEVTRVVEGTGENRKEFETIQKQRERNIQDINQLNARYDKIQRNPLLEVEEKSTKLQKIEEQVNKLENKNENIDKVSLEKYPTHAKDAGYEVGKQTNIPEF